jgi:hypothetical protein
MMDLNGSQRGRAPTWVRNNIVGLVALFVALSGTTYAAQAINDQGGKGTKAAKKKVKRGPPGPAGPQGPPGSPATNALTLGGLPASSYQQGCSAGAIWGFATINTDGLVEDGPFTSNGVAAFNCRGGAVEVRRVDFNEYTVRFVGSIAGFAVASVNDPGPANGRIIVVRSNGTPGEFTVETTNDVGNLVGDTTFTIVAV